MIIEDMQLVHLSTIYINQVTNMGANLLWNNVYSSYVHNSIQFCYVEYNFMCAQSNKVSSLNGVQTY